MDYENLIVLLVIFLFSFLFLSRQEKIYYGKGINMFLELDNCEHTYKVVVNKSEGEKVVIKENMSWMEMRIFWKTLQEIDGQYYDKDLINETTGECVDCFSPIPPKNIDFTK